MLTFYNTSLVHVNGLKPLEVPWNRQQAFSALQGERPQVRAAVPSDPLPFLFPGRLLVYKAIRPQAEPCS